MHSGDGEPANGSFDVEALVARAEASAGQGATEEARELVRGVLAFHKEGLARVVEIARATESAKLMRRLAEDPLVAGLLVLHDLHPDSFETRARDAVARVALDHPALTIESLVGSELKLRMNEQGVNASLSARLVEAALSEALPDASRIEFVEEALIRLRRKEPV